MDNFVNEPMDFDKLFRDKLQPREETPSDDVWARLSKMLDEQEEAKIVPIVPIRKTRWLPYGVAASVLLLAVSFVWWAGRQEGAFVAQHIEKEQASITALRPDIVWQDAPNVARQETTDKTWTEPDPRKKKTAEPPNSSQNKPQKTNKPAKPAGKPKTIKPLPARTELIGMELDLEVKFKKIRIELQPEEPFEEAIVSISQDGKALPTAPQAEKRSLLTRLLKGKERETRVARRRGNLERVMAYLRD